MPDIHTVREHEEFKVGELDLGDLEAVQRDSASRAENGVAKLVFSRKRDGALAAGNHVGVITTRRGTVVEILPKIDLGGQVEQNYEITRGRFLEMLRWHRGLRKAAQLPESSIRGVRRFPMLEIFVLGFLRALNALVRGGLARRYQTVEESLPYLRGRILFAQQLRENLVNQARFFVSHDELSVNRPANRLIHSALARLAPQVRSAESRQLLHQLTAAFSHVPQAANLQGDWQRHNVDRSMRHYGPVMQWVGMFLFNHGLATFAGRHVNLSLLFPMEEVFEDFVTHCFRRYQNRYEVTAQGPQKYLAERDHQDTFKMKPDISLRPRGNHGNVVFILDAKWKNVVSQPDAHPPQSGGGREPARPPSPSISPGDAYQLYAYGSRYQCKAVALLYPRTPQFRQPRRFRFFDGRSLVCLPFDVSKPEGSVRQSIAALENAASA